MRLIPAPEVSAVLDSCVLAPMPLCDLLLRCAEEPALFRVLWSEQILEEVARTLQKFGYSQRQVDRRLASMREAFPEAAVSVQRRLVVALEQIPDPDDRHVAAAAVQACAGVIVTFNLKHFPARVLAPFGIQAQSPETFLIDCFHRDSRRMTMALDEQAMAIQEQRSAILKRLRASLPGFVQLAEAHD